MSKTKVTIIGAGLSGLTAAYRLSKLGYPVEVYEARHRPGGRVHSVRFGDSCEELGGKNLNDGNAALNVRALIDEMGLKVQPYILKDARPFLHKGTVHSLEKLFKDAPIPNNENLASLKQRVTQCKNLKELLDPFYKDSLLRDFMEFAMTLWEGLPPNLLAPQYLDFGFWNFYRELYNRKLDLEENRRPEKTFDTVEGGNSRLIEALVNKLSGCIHYNSPLRKMTKLGDKTILHFDKGKTVLAEYVILALPCSTLRDVEFEAGLIPEDQLFAINTQRYGTNAKFLVPVANAKEEGLSFLDNSFVWFNSDYSVITVYYGGESGVFDFRSESALNTIFKREKQALSILYPNIKISDALPMAAPKTIWEQCHNQPVAISWSEEEFSKGSYACYGHDQFELFENMIEDFGEVTKKVFRTIGGRIFFAGEHAAILEPATLEGATAAGEDAARRVDCAQKIRK